MPITSSKNPLLQEVRKAGATGSPTDAGLVVAEGPHLLEEALRGVWGIEQVLVADSFRARHAMLLAAVKVDVVEVSDRAFEAAAATQAHQGVITLLRRRSWTWADFGSSGGPTVVLDGIQDPGNAGTIIRSAESFGASGVIFLRGSVHVANGKLLRAAAGSAFRIPILEDVTPEEMLSQTRRHGRSLYALSVQGDEDLSEVDLTGPVALVLGSEGAGISPTIEKKAQSVRIAVEMVESLNVGIAGSIALFEAARQRRKP